MLAPSTTFGQDSSFDPEASRHQSAPSTPSSSWTEKAFKIWQAIPAMFVVLLGIGGFTALCIGLAFQLWFVAGVAGGLVGLCRLVYLLQWEHIDLTTALLEGAAVPIVVQQPAAVKPQQPMGARSSPAAQRTEPVSELDLTGFAGSLGFHMQRQGQQLQSSDSAGSEPSAAGRGGTLRKLKQTALAKEYLLVCKALSAYRAAHGALEPESPRAAAEPRSPGGMPSPNAARGRNVSLSVGTESSEGSDTQEQQQQQQQRTKSPASYTRMDDQYVDCVGYPYRKERTPAEEVEVEPEKKEPEKPRSNFGLFGGR